MNTYICGICGFDYDEALGDPARGIAPGTRFADLPDDWVCPICGADKSMFTAAGGEEPARGQAAPPPAQEEAGTTAMEKSALCSNLARACAKQYRAQEETLFQSLAEWFRARAIPQGGLSDIAAGAREDVGRYPAAMDVCREAGDRGSLRALTWGEKVTKIQNNLLRKAEAGALGAVSGRVFVCEACGFIFVGDAAPDICPVCKVPAFKFNEVKREA